MNKMNKETRDVRTTGVSLRVWIVLIVLCLVNVAAHLIVMPSLPAQIPTHWGADGAVDGWGPRWMASALDGLRARCSTAGVFGDVLCGATYRP